MKKGIAFGLAALALAGCGGSAGSGRSMQGRIAVRVAWPAPKGRVIPNGAQSVRVQVLQAATVVNEAILTPSSPQTTFNEVPLGNVTVSAVAFPNANATGNPMATGQTPTTVTADSVTPVDLSMASTIDHLSLSPSTINLALLGLLTRQLVVTAYDSNNAVVLTSSSDYIYSTTNSLLFNVNSTGLVTGLAVGIATVTATDRMNGKSATATVNVTLY